jgi:hypothetical protein
MGRGLAGAFRVRIGHFVLGQMLRTAPCDGAEMATSHYHAKTYVYMAVSEINAGTVHFDVIDNYLACVANTIQQFNGSIARYVGDGVLSYFGWPEARETDERVVRAGLAVVPRSTRHLAGANRSRCASASSPDLWSSES